MSRLAIVATHPIQYYSPWFRYLAERPGMDIKVFYLWNFGTTPQHDPGFEQAIQWDIPLLDGYSSEFVPNRSSRPGTTRFWGIDNPGLHERLQTYAPSAVLCLAYNYATFARFWLPWKSTSWPLLLRGDSHRLVPRTGMSAWAKRKVVNRIFRRFSAFLYVGKANRDYYLQHAVPAEKLFFSPHCVDNERFAGRRQEVTRQAKEWRAELGVPSSHRVVLFAGKFEAVKRVEDLPAAFERVRLPDTSLLLVGAGSDEIRLRKQSASIPNVFFAPFQNQSQMPRVYAAADVVVLPSHSETWGLCINEAMCLGKPVIVSNHVGCGPDLVFPGRNGLIFEAGNVAALAHALTEALADRDRLERWGRESTKIIADYTYARATEGLEQALQTIERPRRAGETADSAPELAARMAR